MMISSAPAANSYAVPIVVHRETPAARWDAYVKRHPAASGYHLAAWLEVIARAFGHDTCALVAESPSGVVGVLPLVTFRSQIFGRFLVSMPFVNYGGILADSPAAERALLTAAIAETRRCGAAHLELRHTRQMFPELACRRHKVAMMLSLEASVDKAWEQLDRKVRNQVRKAQKSQLRVEITGPSERLHAFYGIFARNMRDLGTPVYGRGFFEEVAGCFPANTRIFSVWLGDRPVAASMVYWHGTICEVPWASSVSDFNHLCANTLLYWEMISFAIRQGFHTFDFGRSTPGEGTYHFKKQWGAEAHELVWEYWLAEEAHLPDLSPKNPRFETAIGLWRRLPVPLTVLLGPRIVRNIP
jgi:FemAB-related protein (PEP-CTERM system-associated)